METPMKKMTAALVLSSAAFAAHAIPIPIVLDFEGIGNFNPVGNFYSAQGVTFSPDTLALVDVEAGGTGDFANEPSASTVMFFLDASNAKINVADGFSTAVSFFYSSLTPATVKVYAGLEGTGSLLGSLSLAAQYADNCVGDPSGQFCNWSTVGLSFAGIAKSIDFGGAANQTTFDDITLGAATPGNPENPGNPGSDVPEPTTLALFGVALAGMGAVRRRRAI